MGVYRFPAACASLAVVAAIAVSAPTVAAESGRLQVDIAPERVWRALRADLARDGLPHADLDAERFELRLLQPAGAVRVSVDWDEASGGTALAWTGDTPAAVQATGRWLEQVVADAAALPQENLYCRQGDASDLAVGFVDITPGEAPECGIGKFAAALFELEKCADHESALKILAACVREKNSLGILRLSQHFENGYAVPKRPERMTEYLRLAAEAGTPGYSVKARVQYATALYFGVGVAADRQGALAMFRKLADQGDVDAGHFLQHGYHYAWRRADGSVYRDWGFAGTAAVR